MRPVKRPKSDEMVSQNMDVDFNEKSNENPRKKQRCGYEIAGVVRSKILFDQYPKTIMR